MDYKRIFEVKHLRKIYGFGKSVALAIDDISFDVLDGEFLAIMGSSGSGKTTLLNMLAAITKPTKGQILFDGKDIKTFSREEISKYRGNKISYIFQDFKLIDTMTCYENIIIPLKIHGKVIDDKEIQDMALKLGVSDLLKKYPDELSGGQKQRVAALRAIIVQPNVILADEPTGALDSKNSEKLLNTISRLNKDYNTTVIMVTHDRYAASFSERILFLSDGKIFNEISRFEDETDKKYYNRISEASRQINR